MTIVLKSGIDQLQFGMPTQKVIELLGKPDKEWLDEDENTIFEYYKDKLRLTFYADEQFKLGYIITTNVACSLFDASVIEKSWNDIKAHLTEHKVKTFETTFADGVTQHFNEENWLMIHEEFGGITRLEMGAVFNAKDEFEWKYKG
jgi:hypothetical protein